MKLRLEWDRRLPKEMKARGLEKALNRALKKAGGDALRSMRTNAVKHTRERKRIKAKEIRRAIALEFPRASRELGMSWTLRVKDIPVPLSAYPNRQVKKGVSVEVNRGARKLVKSAFVATMKSGHKGVFVRRGKSRLPIDELFSTSVRQVFNDDNMIPSLFSGAQSTFAASFDRLLSVEISKSFAPRRQA